MLSYLVYQFKYFIKLCLTINLALQAVVSSQISEEGKFLTSF